MMLMQRRHCMLLHYFGLMSLSAAWPTFWWADWKEDGGCTPPTPGELIMGNTAETDAPLYSWSLHSNISLELDGSAVEGFLPAVSYQLRLSSRLPAGHLLHVSSGELSGLSSDGAMSCSGQSAAWNAKGRERTLTWTPSSGDREVVITLSAAEDYLPVEIGNITYNALDVRLQSVSENVSDVDSNSSRNPGINSTDDNGSTAALSSSRSGSIVHSAACLLSVVSLLR
eukprot:TRINITY_DN6524_c0_g1_i3.p1 TRINITY_DN6524_c0_g1~~TRINITY_DN6524_c0_g1_i3.p1  ORF type:complete len:227 (+),score=35.74 TRINITY_DN6524_c0_g1_i3:85-765(+)